MKKASGILITKDNDYGYINTFIDFLERIVNIIMGIFERLVALSKKTSATDAAPSEAASASNG